MPERAYADDAGYDLYAPESAVVPAHGTYTFDTGVHFEIPHGYAGFIKSKSGLNVKHDILSDGLIDEGFRGSVRVKLYNHGDHDYKIDRGNKISQIVFQKVFTPELEQTFDEFDETDRGSNGFGSSGY